MSDKRHQAMKLHAQYAGLPRFTVCGLSVDEFHSSVGSGGREYSLRFAERHEDMTCKRCVRSLYPKQFPPKRDLVFTQEAIASESALSKEQTP